MIPIFIKGMGTDTGKTVIFAIVALALGADQWKLSRQVSGIDGKNLKLL